VTKATTGAKYKAFHDASVKDPEGFWGKAAEELFWYKKWDKVLDSSNPPFYKWFVGGKTNICYNAVDRHALGKGRGKAAIIWESAEQGKSRIITYFELYKEVNRFAGVLKNMGVKKGDRVVIYMPMIPEAFIAMLGCVRIGAVHSVVFAGFSVEALADRINDAQARCVITADGGLRRGGGVPLKAIVDKALDKAPVPLCIVVNRGVVPVTMKEGRDYDWATLMKEKGEAYVEPEQMDSSDPSYILYTSGTTGKPKGVVRDTGGYQVALYNSMKWIYNCNEGDVFWSTSDIGWVVGHSYIIYAPLLYGITTVMYEGSPDYPDLEVWWRLVEKYGVSVMFSAPTAIKMLKKYSDKYMKMHDISSVRYIFLAGEALDAPTWQWATDATGLTVIDHYWQTETGWPMIADMAGVELLPIKPGSPTKAVAGYNLMVVDEKGEPVAAGAKGYLAAKPPLPPGTLLTIWRDDERVRTAYYGLFPGKFYYSTGDYAIMDEDGYIIMLGRADEVLKVAGHRLGTREIEEAISSHPAISEVAIIGVSDAIKGEEPLCLAILKDAYAPSEELKKEIKALVREKIGPIASLKDIKFVKMLPKTRSGKYMRRVIRAVYEGQNLKDLSTIEDGASIDEIRAAVGSIKDELTK